MTWNLAMYTGKPYILSPEKLDILTYPPNPMMWMAHYYEKTGGHTPQKEKELNQVMDWMPRSLMLNFQYIGILGQGIQGVLQIKNILSSTISPMDWTDLLAFAMNYMYLVPQYPLDFVKNESEIAVTLANPDAKYFAWYMHWFVEVLAGQIQSAVMLVNLPSSLILNPKLSHAMALKQFVSQYNQFKFLTKAILIGLPQFFVISWISSDVIAHTDLNDSQRYGITMVNTLAWLVDTSSYFYMFSLAAHPTSDLVSLRSYLIDFTMMGLYQLRMGLMMTSGKFGLID